MIGNLIKKVIGSKNDRELKAINLKYVDPINRLEEKISKLTDSELASKTIEFRQRISNGADLDSLIVEGFAVVREASKRFLGMRHFDVQLLGGVTLHRGKIIEMKTGEGKTLVATLAAYLNGLSGLGVHVVTVNDYLAQRDSEWMGKIYKGLGLTVGVIKHGLDSDQRKQSYSSDITYATNNELAFDYLKDNMVISIDDIVQRRNFAIVDEVDSILIDEARTPLIISGRSEESTSFYYETDRTVRVICKDKENYTIDEKSRVVMLSEKGIARAEELLNLENLYSPLNIDKLHHVQVGMKAHLLFKRDVDYVVKDDKIVIVDEFTGRLMPGRRWSDGVHQAIEAKESVTVENENQTVATITFQNFFRLYDKLSGMTGTADTEASEFASIYDLDVVIIPTNLNMIRDDQPDLVYKTEKEKTVAIIEDIVSSHKRGQPVLVGTASIEKSEELSAILKKRNLRHSVLNAKYHEREAEIIAQAGRFKAITISTNMAGRGTDIVLGGNPEMMLKVKYPNDEPEQYEDELNQLKVKAKQEKDLVLKEGGLRVIGTERHESRRIDNQLRGRSGRQGDPGSSRFYLSLQDNLIRVFGGEKIESIMSRVWSNEGEPIESRLLSRSIENAQRMVEAHNFDMRKHLLEYDDVLNSQRESIYDQRLLILKGDTEDLIEEMTEQLLDETIETYLDQESENDDQIDFAGFIDSFSHRFNIALKASDKALLLPGFEEPFDIKTDRQELKNKLFDLSVRNIEKVKEGIDPFIWKQIEKNITLSVIDSGWKDHLLSMDYLKEGIGFRGYAQKNPLIEYKREGMELFVNMLANIRVSIISTVSHLSINVNNQSRIKEEIKDKEELHKGEQAKLSIGSAEKKQETYRRKTKKVGRNDQCPCGSGKKYKKCCMLKE